MFEDTNWDKFIRDASNDEKECSVPSYATGVPSYATGVLSPVCNCDSIKLESTPCPVHDLNIFMCPSCLYRIDPDYCWCGEGRENHGYRDGHSFIPMGCQCGFVKGA